MSADPITRGGPQVYFIRAAAGIGAAKIGYSQDPASRAALMTYSCPFPLEVIASFPGDFTLERRFHALFLSDRSHSEWFRWSDRMAAVVDAINDGTFDFDSLPPPASTGKGLNARSAIPIAATNVPVSASPAVPVPPDGTAGASFCANARTPWGLQLHHFEGQS